MILEPTNDRACLGQLTRIARELAPTTLIRAVAERLGSPSEVQAWLQSLPQTNDDGAELYRAITCDVSQRVRLLPDDPNCFERALAALALLEVLDPQTLRKVATADQPARHTGVVEWRGDRWVALDVFPRRNFNWGRLGGNVLSGIQGANQFVGKPVLSFYGLGGASDLIDLGASQLKAGLNEKKAAPPGPGSAEQQAIIAAALRAVGGKTQTEPGKGGSNGTQAQETTQRAPQATALGGTAPPASRNGAAVGETAEAERGLGRWWGLE